MDEKILIYSQKGGTLRAFANGQDFLFAEDLYAGRLDAKNKPDQDHRKNRGPLPRGFYRIGRPFNHATCGRYVLRLTPEPGNQMHGRDGFLIHGASRNPARTGQESEGCIIAPLEVRQAIVKAGFIRLEVVR